MFLLTVTNYVIMVLISTHLTLASCNTALSEFKQAHPGNYQIDCIQIKGERV